MLALSKGMMYCGQVLHQCTGIRYACHHAHQLREPRTAGMDSEYKEDRCIQTYIKPVYIWHMGENLHCQVWKPQITMHLGDFGTLLSVLSKIFGLGGKVGEVK